MSNSGEDEHEQVKIIERISSILPSAEDSLKIKQKGQRISYHERVHLYKQMKKGEWSLAEIAVGNNLSLGTLYNIRKELDAKINDFTLEKSTTRRNLVESSMIQKIVSTYLSKTKTPWSSKDIWAYIRAKTGLVIQQGTIRRVLVEALGMRYKKGKARLVTFDEALQSLIKQWFSIKIWKSIERFKLLINIDETSFSRLTKKSLSWIPKGKEQIIKNICFRNSWSLIMAITSNGSTIAAKQNGSITSILIIDFLRELVRFVKESEGVEPEHCLVILDNASIHRSEIVRKKMQSENLNMAYIPQYSPELAPIEHYFSKTKTGGDQQSERKRRRLEIHEIKWDSQDRYAGDSFEHGEENLDVVHERNL